MTSKEELIEKFNSENEVNGGFYYEVDFVKNVLPTEKDFKIAFNDWLNYVDVHNLKDMNGIYTNGTGSNYLIDICFRDLYELGILDLKKIQDKTKEYTSKQQLIDTVYNLCERSINWIEQNKNSLIIEGMSAFIGKAKNITNPNFSALLLDDYLSNNNQPPKDTYNKIASFKKQYEQLEKA